MCGRFAQPHSADDLARIFRARAAVESVGSGYNVAPTDPVLAVLERHDERIVDGFRWGLVPYYAATSRDGARLINARAETVERSPAFRTSFSRRRCIIPAAAFYEWRRHRDPVSGRVVRREPFAIRSARDEPLALAGVWATWRDPQTAERLYTCSILTTEPNEVVSRLHDRMPVILDPGDWDVWLAADTPPAELRAMLHPAPDDALEAYPVSPAVNNVRSEGAELLLPVSRWSDR